MVPVGVGDKETSTYRTDAIEENAVPRRRAYGRANCQNCHEQDEHGLHVSAQKTGFVSPTSTHQHHSKTLLGQAQILLNQSNRVLFLLKTTRICSQPSGCYQTVKATSRRRTAPGK